jgi:hypothetical protein
MFLFTVHKSVDISHSLTKLHRRSHPLLMLLVVTVNLAVLLQLRKSCGHFPVRVRGEERVKR